MQLGTVSGCCNASCRRRIFAVGTRRLNVIPCGYSQANRVILLPVFNSQKRMLCPSVQSRHLVPFVLGTHGPQVSSAVALLAMDNSATARIISLRMPVLPLENTSHSSKEEVSQPQFVTD